MHAYWSVFVTLIVTPFEHVTLIWGIVPLYVGWLLNESTSSKANYRTAIQSGFSFIWAGTQWFYPYFVKRGPHDVHLDLNAMLPVNLAVTALVLVLGVIALVSGLRKRFPKYGRFLGHTRFSNYFMITVYPMQAHYLPWTWTRLETLALFAVPVWVVIYLGLMPLRQGK